jgi:hypothetical protein
MRWALADLAALVSSGDESGLTRLIANMQSERDKWFVLKGHRQDRLKSAGGARLDGGRFP